MVLVFQIALGIVIGHEAVALISLVARRIDRR